jgi:hypothetical protein
MKSRDEDAPRYLPAPGHDQPCLRGGLLDLGPEAAAEVRFADCIGTTLASGASDAREAGCPGTTTAT